MAAHTGLVKIAAELGVVCMSVVGRTGSAHMSVAEGLGVAPGPIPNDNVTGGKFRDGALNIFGGVVIFAKADEEVDGNFSNLDEKCSICFRNSRLLTYEWCF